MNYAAFASDLPAERTMTFRSAEENEEFLLCMGINQEMRQLRKGAFRSDIATRTFGTVGLYADRFSSACRMYLEPLPGEIGLLWLRSAGAPLLASGIDAANSKLLFLPKSTVIGLVLPDMAGSEVIGIPEKRFRQMFAAFCPGCEPPERTTLFEGDTAQLQTLGRSVLKMFNEPGKDLRAEWVPNLLTATFNWIDETNERSQPERLRSRTAYRRAAKQAEDFICEHYRDEVHTEDICRQTGIGLRSLQRSVRTYFGVTITKLIESVRMKSAHHDLSRLRPEESTVTRVALDNGFKHLGRFSVAYHRRYGERPNEQLAHMPGMKS